MILIKKHHRSFPTAKGFTLLEVILTVGMVSLLFSSILIITSSSLELTNTLVDSQKKSMSDSDFKHFLTNNINRVTSSSKFELSKDQANQNIQTLTILDPNQYFPYQGQDTLSRQSSYALQFNDSGLLDLVNIHSIKDPENPSNETLLPVYEISLKKDLADAYWEFYDKLNQEWLDEWNAVKGRPSLVRLQFKETAESTPETILIWLLLNN